MVAASEGRRLAQTIETSDEDDLILRKDLRGLEQKYQALLKENKVLKQLNFQLQEALYSKIFDTGELSLFSECRYVSSISLLSVYVHC